MKLLYLCYWGITDPLTISTVLPHVRILTELPAVERVILCTLERSTSSRVPHQLTHGARHRPIATGPGLWNKLEELLKVPKVLRNISKQESIDRVICRSSLAGSLAYLAIKNRLPLYVESFEPHAEYMLHSGIWKKYDPRYLLQRKLQEAQKNNATGLMTVSEAYRKKLVSEGIQESRIRTVPCAVNQVQYNYDPGIRSVIRKNLGISEREVVGIYVGKFGGLYYQHEAMRCFSIAYKEIEYFRLIILTPNESSTIKKDLNEMGIPETRYLITRVDPSRVPAYLSAADFGFCFHRTHQFSIGFGPVKNGEYWANGLPILIPNNIGDDSGIATSEGAGATFAVNDSRSIATGISKIKHIIGDPSSRQRIKELALKHKSFSTVKASYLHFLTEDHTNIT